MWAKPIASCDPVSTSHIRIVRSSEHEDNSVPAALKRREKIHPSWPCRRLDIGMTEGAGAGAVGDRQSCISLNTVPDATTISVDFPSVFGVKNSCAAYSKLCSSHLCWPRKAFVLGWYINKELCAVTRRMVSWSRNRASRIQSWVLISSVGVWLVCERKDSS